MLNPQGFQAKQEENRARETQVATDQAALIEQRDNQARQLFQDFDKLYGDLRAIEETDAQIEKLDKQTHQLVEGFLTIQVRHIPTIKGQIKSARDLVIAHNGLSNLQAAGVVVESW